MKAKKKCNERNLVYLCGQTMEVLNLKEKTPTSLRFEICCYAASGVFVLHRPAAVARIIWNIWTRTANSVYFCLFVGLKTFAKHWWDRHSSRLIKQRLKAPNICAHEWMCSTRSIVRSHGKVKNTNGTQQISTHIYHCISMNQNEIKAIQGASVRWNRESRVREGKKTWRTKSICESECTTVKRRRKNMALHSLTI